MLYLIILGALVFATSFPASDTASGETAHSDSFNPADQPAVQSPDFAESPAPGKNFGAMPKSFGNTASSAQQHRGADDDGPTDEPEHFGLPHDRRAHDERRPDYQANNLLYVVRSR